MGKDHCRLVCRFPTAETDPRKHYESYHSNNRTLYVAFKGKKEVFFRNKDGSFDCSCNDCTHSRFNLNVFTKILKLDPHPEQLPAEFDEPYPELEVDPETSKFILQSDEADRLRKTKRRTIKARRGRKSAAAATGKEESVDAEAKMDIDAVQDEDFLMDDSGGDVGDTGLTVGSDAEVEGGEGMGIGDDCTVDVAGADSGVEDQLDERMGGLDLDSDGGDEEGDDWILRLEESGSEHPIRPDIVEKLIVDHRPMPDSSSRALAIQILESLHIIVDPHWKWAICISCGVPFHWATIYDHIRKIHISKTSRVSKFAQISAEIPSESDVLESLLALDADKFLPFPDEPIEAVPGMDQEEAFKCGEDGCNHIRGSKKSLGNHYRSNHSSVPVKKRKVIAVPVHPLRGFRLNRQFIEILPHSAHPGGENVKEILAHAKEHKLGIPSFQYSSPSNKADLNPVFAQFHWNIVLEDVYIPYLRASVQAPDEDAEPIYYRFREISRTYYEKVMYSLDRIDTTTRRWIRTGSENTPLKAVPFRRPQELGTVNRDADMVSTFVIFLHRNVACPVEKFDIILHPVTAAALNTLYDRMSDKNSAESELVDLFHGVVWSYLSNPAVEFLQDELMDPFTRFLIAFHLKDDFGNFSVVKLIPPSIARAQWAFRATSAWEVICTSKNYNNIHYDAYKACVHKWVTDNNPSTFTKMRENMRRFTALVYAEPGISRFTWDATGEVVTIGGFPLSAKRLFVSWKDQVGDLVLLVDDLFRGCEYSDILEYIDSRSDPDPEKSSTWFRDSTSNTDVNFSVFSEKGNKLERFRGRLLGFLAEDRQFFKRVNGKLHANERIIWEWFGKLQDVINLMWYLIHATSPGGARGRESEPLTYANNPHHPKNLHFISGHFCLETVYRKMSSQHGSNGQSIVRIVAFHVARLLVLVLCCGYYAAAHLGLWIGMPKENADNYLYYVFVRYGRPMVSNDFGKILGNTTESTIGFPIFLADFRQLKSNLMLHKAHIKWEEPDEEEEEDVQAHELMGHSAGVGRTHYGRDNRGTRFLSGDQVGLNIRTGIKWLGTIDFLHPFFKSRVAERQRDPSFDGTCSADILEAILDDKLGKSAKVTKELVLSSEQRIIASMKKISSSVGRQITETIIGYINGSPTVPHFNAPPLYVSPNLLKLVSSSIGIEIGQWKSPQQAESVASVLTDQHVFSILATGEGKSLQFFAAPILKPGRLFIVVLPLVSLTLDMQRRLDLMPYHGGIWGTEGLDVMSASLVLVPVHLAGRDEFRRWIILPEILKRLERFFIDEAHHIKTDVNFRECFRTLYHLLSARKPISFLSGSCGPHDIDFIIKAMGLDEPSLITEIRSYCGRPNHRYTHQKVKSSEIFSAVQEYVGDKVLGENDRGLIFVSSVNQCRELAKLLGFEAYYAAETDEQKRLYQQKWRAGFSIDDRWMVCTTAFGEGIDYDNVRYVVAIDPFGMTTLKQQFGRGGRNGDLAHCHLIWSRLPDISKNTSPDKDLEGRLALYILLTCTECMRFAEASYDRVVHSCAAIGGELCQNCLNADNLLEGPTIARLDHPLLVAPDRPVATLDATLIDPDVEMVSVESSTRNLSEGMAACSRQMELLDKVLDRVSASGCQSCWVAGQVHTLHSNHPGPTEDFEVVLRTLRSLEMPSSLHWAYCFFCWVPFRHFNHHVAPEPGAPLIPSDCKYDANMPGMIPSLISHIWTHPEKARGIADKLGVDYWVDHFDLGDWLSAPCDSATAIPNHLQFVNTFYELYVDFT
ncbi:hypothetical protein VKT23_009679 [Stygiomarasmius scandens]|uniref:DNA 3'-5' helicase n=1 Tax=Marasmiellus scandens TaxID=2682957 RepID=A0ABR1IK37_9AGAR